MDVTETPGLGITGTIDGHRVAVGRAAWILGGQPLPAWARRLRRRADLDVATIGNALRAIGSPGRHRRTTRRGRQGAAQDAAVAERFRAEHAELRGLLEQLQGIADRLDRQRPEAAVAEAAAVRLLLAERILPHERAEESLLYPAVAGRIGGQDPTAPMRRAHVEIEHLARLLGRILDTMDPAGVDPEDIMELRRVLYGLQAVLRLHIAQEDEAYLSLFEDPSTAAGSPAAAR